MRTRRFSVQCSAQVLALFVCSGGLAINAGCSDHEGARSEEGNVPEASTGQLQLALTARGSSGSLYRLRQAEFLVQELDPFGGFSTFLSSENDSLERE
jgi:hypothetical protein